MKIGDIIECSGGSRAVIMGAEMLYPGHPNSPVRSFEVLWLNEVPKYSWRVGKFHKVDRFSVKRVVSVAPDAKK